MNEVQPDGRHAENDIYAQSARHHGPGARAGTSGPGRRRRTSHGATSCSRCAASTGWRGSDRRSSPTPTRSSGSGGRSRPARRAAPASTPAAIYLQAKDDLGISAHEIPQLRHLSAQLEQVSGMHLMPAEGLHPVPHVLLVHRRARVPRHAVHPPRVSKPEFTPEPDMIHDCLGHVPPLVNHDYAALLTLLGKAAVSRGDRRPGAGAEATELVLDRVRADRGGGRRRRCSAPASSRRSARSRSRCRRTSSAAPS